MLRKHVLVMAGVTFSMRLCRVDSKGLTEELSLNLCKEVLLHKFV